MAKDVLCAVNSCTYWAEENKCNAESIFVAYHSSKSLHSLKKQTAKLSKVNKVKRRRDPPRFLLFCFPFYQE